MPMDRRLVMLGALALITATATAARAEDAAISIDNFTFAPDVLTVHPGTKVVWTNRDDIPHLVVSSENPVRFKSKTLDSDDNFSMVFDKPGTYAYFCGLHPHMQGSVVVQ
jgi:plastocyanin